MKMTMKKVVIITETYHITDKIKYDIISKNGKVSERKLRYTGKKHYGYSLSPLYRKDFSLLKEKNPYTHSNWDWFKGDILPAPEDIDVEKNIILVQGSTHMFFDTKLKSLTYTHTGDYIGAGLRSTYYDIDKLEKHLKGLKKVVKIIRQEIPYYNAAKTNEEYLSIIVLVPGKVWDMGLEKGWSRDDIVFGRHHDENFFDFLNINQFVINKEI